VGAPAPAFRLPDVAGREVSLADFRGQVVLLNFWALWCEPCKAEMPDFQAALDRFGSEGLAVVSVDLGDSPEKVAEFMQQQRYGFEALVDRSLKTSRTYDTRILPLSLLLDRDGIVRYQRVTPFEAGQLEAHVEVLLGSTADHRPAALATLAAQALPSPTPPPTPTPSPAPSATAASSPTSPAASPSPSAPPLAHGDAAPPDCYPGADPSADAGADPRRLAHPQPHADGVADAHADGLANLDADPHRHAHAHADSHPYPQPNAHPHVHPDAHADSYAYRDGDRAGLWGDARGRVEPRGPARRDGRL
jgi:peroxiredoxin